MDTVDGQLIPALFTCRILAFSNSTFYFHSALASTSFENQNSQSLLSNYIQFMIILYINKMHKIKNKEGLRSHALILRKCGDNYNI